MLKPSEWIAPWRYPATNQAGAGVAQEGAATHVGPHLVGDLSTVLLSGLLGTNGARGVLEECGTPAETAKALDELLAVNEHLGGPIDYGLYLVGRMAAEAGQTEFGVPDFNLDADRGYAWHCWDWDRHHRGKDPPPPDARGTWECRPAFTPVGTPPQGPGLPLSPAVQPTAVLPRRRRQPQPLRPAVRSPRASGTTSCATC